MSDLLAHVELAPSTRAHWPWILATFCEQVRLQPMTSASQAQGQRGALERILRGGIGRAVSATPAGFPDELMGWALSLDGALIFAYVSDDFRRQGLGAALVSRVTDALPVPLAYWTRDAEEMAAHGLAIRYDIHAFRALCSYARRDREPTYTHHQARAT